MVGGLVQEQQGGFNEESSKEIGKFGGWMKKE